MATNPSDQPQNPAPATTPVPVAPAATQNPPPATTPPAPTSVPAPAPTPALPQNPYSEDTAKYRVARALIAGEVDRGKVMRECGVKLNTVYNVTGELSQMGYMLPIHEKAKKRVTLPPPPRSLLPPPPTTQNPDPATQNATQGGSGGASGGASGETSPPITQQNTTQGVTQQPPPATTSPPVSGNNNLGGGRNNSPGGSPQQLPPETMGQLANMVADIIRGKPQPAQPELPGTALPIEEVELVREKVNYEITLNPEIFYRYSIFKARAAMS